MKSFAHSCFVAALTSGFLGCASVPPPEVEAMTLDIPTYLEENLDVSYLPAKDLQFGNMTCLLDEKLRPSKSQSDLAFVCNEFRQSGVNVNLGWIRTSHSPNEIEAEVSRSMRVRSRLGPAEESSKDAKVCKEEKTETLGDKGVLLRCSVDFFTTQAKYKRATFSVYYLKPQAQLDYQLFVVTEGAFGRGDEEAQRDVVRYAEALNWIGKK